MLAQFQFLFHSLGPLSGSTFSQTATALSQTATSILTHRRNRACSLTVCVETIGNAHPLNARTLFDLCPNPISQLWLDPPKTTSPFLSQLHFVLSATVCHGSWMGSDDYETKPFVIEAAVAAAGAWQSLQPGFGEIAGRFLHDIVQNIYVTVVSHIARELLKTMFKKSCIVVQLTFYVHYDCYCVEMYPNPSDVCC
jgi:hypothetical protein